MSPEQIELEEVREDLKRTIDEMQEVMTDLQHLKDELKELAKSMYDQSDAKGSTLLEGKGIAFEIAATKVDRVLNK